MEPLITSRLVCTELLTLLERCPHCFFSYLLKVIPLSALSNRKMPRCTSSNPTLLLSGVQTAA